MGTLRKLLLVMVYISFLPLAQAADFILSKDLYGSINLDLPQSLMSVMESNISGNGNYEPLKLSPPQDMLRKIARPVGRLDVQYGDGMSTCTASIVSETQILTNYHCIPGTGKHGKIEKASILMGYLSQTDTRGTKRYKVKIIPVVSDKNLDFALLEVAGRPAKKWGTVKLVKRDPMPGESLMIIHHPLGLPLHVTRGRCRAANPRSVDNTDIFHTCDTESGSSGSPILTGDGKNMLGIHFSGVYGNVGFNRGKRLAAISKKYTELENLIGKSKPSMPQIIDNPSPVTFPQKRRLNFDLTAKHGIDTVFLMSSYRTVEEMDTAGCKSANTMALAQAKQRCSDKSGHFKKIKYTSCNHTGQSVRRYEVNVVVTCE